MRQVFFTADTHFNHEEVIGYCKRPWSTVEEMNAALVANWNEVVGKNDLVYHVGDLGFGGKSRMPILKALNGKIVLIEGNHDRQNKFNVAQRSRFEEITQYKEITVPDPDAWHGRQRIQLCHYASVTWRERKVGGWNFHGHSHNMYTPCSHCSPTAHLQQLDVGVDAHNYYPISYEQAKAILAERKRIATAAGAITLQYAPRPGESR